MGSLGGSDGGERAGSRGGALDKKTTISCQVGLGSDIVFQKGATSRARLLPVDRTAGLRQSKAENDSEMAPQAIEIT
jgi:hypothetical protein